MSEQDKIKAWFQGWMVTKGGPGSGHWGHAGGTGGPGNPGGSVPRETAMSIAGGKTAQVRQAIARDLSKEIAVLSRNDKGRMVIASPYNADFVEDLRDNVTSSMKVWSGSEKTWTIHPSAEAKVRDIVAKHYHTMDRKDFSQKDISQVVRFRNVERIKDDQKFLKTREREMEERVQSLEDALGKASKSKKQNILRRQALFTYALLDMRAKPESLERIQRLSLAKVRRILEGKEK